MAFSITRSIALLLFLFGVPGGIWLTYRGHTMGLYPYGAIPFVFVFAFLVVIGILLVVLPVLSRWERDREG